MILADITWKVVVAGVGWVVVSLSLHFREVIIIFRYIMYNTLFLLVRKNLRKRGRMGVGRAEQSFKFINRWQSQFKLWSNVREHKGLQNTLNIFYNKLQSFFPICSL